MAVHVIQCILRQPNAQKKQTKPNQTKPKTKGKRKKVNTNKNSQFDAFQ